MLSILTYTYILWIKCFYFVTKKYQQKSSTVDCGLLCNVNRNWWINTIACLIQFFSLKLFLNFLLSLCFVVNNNFRVHGLSQTAFDCCSWVFTEKKNYKFQILVLYEAYQWNRTFCYPTLWNPTISTIYISKDTQRSDSQQIKCMKIEIQNGCFTLINSNERFNNILLPYFIYDRVNSQGSYSSNSSGNNCIQIDEEWIDSTSYYLHTLLK